jgi:hypothetical protein
MAFLKRSDCSILPHLSLFRDDSSLSQLSHPQDISITQQKNLDVHTTHREAVRTRYREIASIIYGKLGEKKDPQEL